jgi:5-methyltetrahydrofolate--homocysteine methyltransferase
LASRLADAFAEHLHRQVREDWGYGAGEALSRDDIALGRYRGMRVSPGSRAWPDTAGRAALFRLLHAEEIGLSLDDSCTMRPEASVTGLYLSHPDAMHFEVGTVEADQLADYAERVGQTAASVQQRLSAPNGL